MAGPVPHKRVRPIQRKDGNTTDRVSTSIDADGMIVHFGQMETQQTG